VDDLLTLILAGLTAGAALALLFGDATHAVAKLLALGAAVAVVAGWAFYELATGPDLHGTGAPLEGIVAVVVVAAGSFFLSWAAGAITALAARSLALRRAPRR
jgi:hypothetical protein